VATNVSPPSGKPYLLRAATGAKHSTGVPTGKVPGYMTPTPSRSPRRWSFGSEGGGGRSRKLSALPEPSDRKHSGPFRPEISLEPLRPSTPPTTKSAQVRPSLGHLPNAKALSPHQPVVSANGGADHRTILVTLTGARQATHRPPRRAPFHPGPDTPFALAARTHLTIGLSPPEAAMVRPPRLGQHHPRRTPPARCQG